MRIHFGAGSGLLAGRQGPFSSVSEDGRVLAVEAGLDPISTLEIALKKANKKLEDAKQIAVHAGPSGFSDVRRRVSAANALAFALMIPLSAVGDKTAEDVAAMSDDAFASEAVMPLYAGAPNITKSKKRSPLWNAR